MGWPVCNATLEEETISEEPIWHGLTIHQLGLRVSAACGVFAVGVSLALILLHATHYARPHQQRHILRILFMVPIYAAVSFLSFYYYKHTIYFEVIRDCYEAFAIASFFSLMCAYLEEDLHRQKDYFRHITPKNWVWPLTWVQKIARGDRGPFRRPRSGLTWFNIIWVSVFQYCFIRVTMTLVSLVTQIFGRYCLESINPAFAHVWVMVIEGGAVTIAMYAIIQFYIQIRQDIAVHRPILKVTAIKLVIFLSFWQSIAISFLTSTGALKPTPKIQTPDIKVGIPAMLLCIEMAIFSIFHIFAFSWRPYVIGSSAFQHQTAADTKPTPDRYLGGVFGTRALLDAFNPWDFVKSTARSFRWLFVGRKTRHTDISYQSTRMDSNLKFDDPHGAPTAYKSARPLAGAADDQQTLLSAPQPVPGYPSSHGHPGGETSVMPSPYGVDHGEYFDPGDIGIAQSTNTPHAYHAEPVHAQSTWGEQAQPPPSHFRTPSSTRTAYQKPHYPAYQTYPTAPSGYAPPSASHRQESGVISTRPAPESDRQPRRYEYHARTTDEPPHPNLGYPDKI